MSTGNGATLLATRLRRLIRVRTSAVAIAKYRCELVRSAETSVGNIKSTYEAIAKQISVR